jgi:hypothetical protein
MVRNWVRKLPDLRFFLSVIDNPPSEEVMKRVSMFNEIFFIYSSSNTRNVSRGVSPGLEKEDDDCS